MHDVIPRQNAHTHTHVSIYHHISILSYIHIIIYPYVYVYIYIHTHTHIFIYIYTYAIHVHVYAQAFADIWRELLWELLLYKTVSASRLYGNRGLSPKHVLVDPVLDSSTSQMQGLEKR